MLNRRSHYEGGMVRWQKPRPQSLDRYQDVLQMSPDTLTARPISKFCLNHPQSCALKTFLHKHMVKSNRSRQIVIVHHSRVTNFIWEGNDRFACIHFSSS